MNIKWKSFSALTKDELYALLNLRQQVFVVEQDCPFIDADFKDQDCDHLLAYQDNELVGYLRVVKPGKQYHGPEIGRVLTAEKIRREGAGKILTQEAIEFCATKYAGQEISISAQHRLQDFYRDFGFIVQGEVYLEDDIDHIKMTLTPKKQMSNRFLQWRFEIHPLLILGGIISIAIIGSSFIQKVDLTQLNWVAKIDERAISKEKYETYLESIAQSRKTGLIESDPENILERMIDEELLIQRGIDLGMIENNPEIRSMIIQKMISSIVAETDNLRISTKDLKAFYSANQDLFTPSPKLHLIKLSFASDQRASGITAKDFLADGDLAAAKSLASIEVISLPNTLLPAMKVREYIGPYLTQVALGLQEGEVSDLIELDDQFHLLVPVQKVIQGAPEFNDIYQEVESEYIRFKGEEMLDEYLEDLRNWYDVVKANDL
ncbi:MAG: GNAT family N-acetyltransferase [SAR86 cluster bacterium]|jgi:ElaA protein|nr:GNAT family N-acetyltransferase [Gammaproteobacteria bacterium]MDG2347652.1 GNAT family N-acetyltransferase [SAR86 cluster bacterium]